MAKKPTKSSRKFRAEPRPSYKPVQDELRALMISLAIILRDEEDENGELSKVQLAQADAAHKLLSGATALLECPQLFGPYEPHQRLRSKSRSE